MPMLVFGLNEENSIVNTAHGKFTGTKVLIMAELKIRRKKTWQQMREFRYMNTK